MNKLIVLIVFILASCSSINARRTTKAFSPEVANPRFPAQSGSSDVPAMTALKALLGDYSGEWRSYGLDKSGEVQLLCSWTDKISISSPQLGSDGLIGDRAFGDVRDKIYYQPNCGRKDEVVELTEGFKLRDSSGAVGDHYFAYHDKNSGKTYETVEQEAGTNRWKYDSPVFDISDFSGLGVTSSNLLFAKNFTVKVMRVEGLVEIQDVTQTTVVAWIRDDNSVQTMKFVSRTGQHKRTLVRSVL